LGPAILGFRVSAKKKKRKEEFAKIDRVGGGLRRTRQPRGVSISEKKKISGRLGIDECRQEEESAEAK